MTIEKASKLTIINNMINIFIDVVNNNIKPIIPKKYKCNLKYNAPFNLL